MIFIGVVALVALITLVTMGVILTRLYRRASKELAFVRTGAGGQKVVKDGGALVLPVFHETIPINMQTLCLTVQRRDNEALITKDRLRVNVQAEFYVRVKPDEEHIATAAQTLGRRTLEPRELAQLIEGKFVDALRAVGASMELSELHEKRNHFVQEVQNTVANDLTKNGLELESVSLTALDQTDAKYFNPNNAFDAEGLAKLTRITEERRRERNEIEATTRVAIEEKNLETNAKSLKIKQDQDFATLEAERQTETRRAEQSAQLATQRAEREREAEVSRISAEQATESARIAKDQAVKAAEIEAAKNIELANQDQRIAIAQKSEAQSRAQAEADAARAEAVRASEAVKTVEAEAAAERAKKVAVIQAEQEAEKDATKVRVMAAAELAAASNQADARMRLADAEQRRYEVEAAGQRALNDASNVLSVEQVKANVQRALIEQMPAILAQVVKPMEAVDSVRIIQMGGTQAGSSASVGGETSGNMPNQLTSALLNYRLQAPMVDEALKEIGIDLSKGMSGITDAVQFSAAAPHPIMAEQVSPQAIESRTQPEELQELQTLAGITPRKGSAKA